MSIKAMTWAFEQPLSGNEKVVLLCLADFANDDGACWPSVKTIAEKAYISEATVKRIMLDLADGGYLSSVRRSADDGRSMSNLYQLHMQGGGAQNEPLGAHSYERGRGSTVNPPYEPSIEPSINKNTREAKTAAKATRVPEEFYPSPACFMVGDELGFDYDRVMAEVAAFLDHWRSVPAGKGLKLDWQATFRNWLRNSAKFARGKTYAQDRPKPNSISDSFAVIDAELAARSREVAEALEREGHGGENLKLVS